VFVRLYGPMNDTFAINRHNNLRERIGKTRKIKGDVICNYCIYLNELHYGKFLKFYIFIVAKRYLDVLMEHKGRKRAALQRSAQRGMSNRNEILAETEGNNHFGYPSIERLVILEGIGRRQL